MNALGQMFNGSSPAETLELARLACEVGDDAPQSAVCRWVVELIDERESYTRRGRRTPSASLQGCIS